MDNFYKYYIRYYVPYTDEIKEDIGLVYSIEGNIPDATYRVCEDYCGNNDDFTNILTIEISNINEEGKYTLSKDTILSFSEECFNGK